MSMLDTMQTRSIQRKANNFVKSLQKKKDETEIKQMYLDNKDLENNEVVLSYLFFNHPSLISILPLEFQIARINSNLSMFKYGSNDAKKKLVSKWISENKFFMNANVVNFDEEEYYEYIKIYFNQPEDIAKLYMEDIAKVLKILVSIDAKETEEIVIKNKDNLTDRQWEFVIQAYAPFIKYATQNVQDKYSNDNKYNKYINNSARNIYINNELDKLKEDFSNFDNYPLDVKCEYIKEYPYMINDISFENIIELLKYDLNLLKYVNMPALRSNREDADELFYVLFNNIETKSSKEIVDLFVSKGLFNAKGKLYRFDKTSNDISYQYTEKMIYIIQKLSIDQIISLIMIDVNYVLPYVVPLYHENDSINIKEQAIMDSNSRCLNLFKAYYSNEIYAKYYKVINKIYNEILNNVDKYYYFDDYDSVYDLFKVLFNKNIINENKPERITVFIGMTLLYKSSGKDSKSTSINLLNDILSSGYKKNIINSDDLYDINSLEICDDRLSFINNDLLIDYFKYNFANISSLLFIVKAKKVCDYFKKYYEIVTSIYEENKETLFRCVESFQYYLPLLKDLDEHQLDEEDTYNLVQLFATFGNYCNITKYKELKSYNITLLKELVGELGTCKNDDAYRNLICNYLFARGYNQKGNSGLLEVATIREICNTFNSDALEDLVINNEKVFTQEECNLFKMISLLFSTTDNEMLMEYIENFIDSNSNRNILPVIELFNKLKKYRVELINMSIVTLEEIDEYSKERPDLISKEYIKDVCVYNVYDQSFIVLSSLKDDKTYFSVNDISDLTYNTYGFNKLLKNRSIRFSEEDGKSIIKMNKDSLDEMKMNPAYIIVTKKLTDRLIDIASRMKLPIVVYEKNDLDFNSNVDIQKVGEE